MRPRDPWLKLGRGPHGLVRTSVDRSARLPGACGREVGGRSALRNGLRRRKGRRGAGLALRWRFAFAERSALAAGPSPSADEARVGLDRGRVDAANLSGAAGERRELHRLEKGDEPLPVELRRRQGLERRLHRHVAIQCDELLRDHDALDDFWIDERFAPLRLFDFAGAGEELFEIAIFENELRRGLNPDAGRAGDVVGEIAGQRLDVDDLIGPDSSKYLTTSSTPKRRSSRSPEAGSYIDTPGPTSCMRSLSAETMRTSAFASRAWRA